MFYRIRRIFHCSFWLLVVPKDAASHRFTSFAEIENWLQNWIASKDELFFRDGIRKLPERGEKVIGSDNILIDLFIRLFWNKCIFEHKKMDRTNLYSQYNIKNLKIYNIIKLIANYSSWQKHSTKFLYKARIIIQKMLLPFSFNEIMFIRRVFAWNERIW